MVIDSTLNQNTPAVCQGILYLNLTYERMITLKGCNGITPIRLQNS